MDNTETSGKETPTPELMTAGTCQISGSQRKAEVFKLQNNSKKDDQLFRPSQQELN
jgi:hypothetical protein